MLSDTTAGLQGYSEFDPCGKEHDITTDRSIPNKRAVQRHESREGSVAAMGSS